MATTLRFRIIVDTIAAVALVGAFFILNRSESSASRQSTDDAYVPADFTVIAPQVGGFITEGAVADHLEVQVGALLVSIDERDLRIAVNNASAQVASAQASIGSLQAQIARQQSIIKQARATVVAAGANLKLAQANRSRFTNLARDGYGTVQAQQQAEAQWDIQRAVHERDRAGLHSAEQQTTLLAVQAEKAAADLNLSYARVTAPVGGIIAQRWARVGGCARVGEPLLTLVPQHAVYVEASFRETQLARVHVGQPVGGTVDALPGLRLKGRVESSGAS